MAELELQQIRMKLSTDSRVLSALRVKKLLRKEKDGNEFVEYPFNSIGIRFHKGEIKTLGKNVADSIYRSAWVNVDINDPLTGELVHTLEVVEAFSLGDTIEQRAVNSGLFDCPVPDCNKSFETASKLGSHLSKYHSDVQEKAGALLGSGPEDEQGGEGENDL